MTEPTLMTAAGSQRLCTPPYYQGVKAETFQGLLSEAVTHRAGRGNFIHKLAVVGSEDARLFSLALAFLRQLWTFLHVARARTNEL